MKSCTTIRIRKSMRDHLARLKLHPRESYDEVINREISRYLSSHPIEEIRSSIKRPDVLRATAKSSGKQVSKDIKASEGRF